MKWRGGRDWEGESEACGAGRGVQKKAVEPIAIAFICRRVNGQVDRHVAAEQMRSSTATVS